jgi:hypothetical protein
VAYSQTGVSRSIDFEGADLTSMANLEEEAGTETIHVKFIPTSRDDPRDTTT